AVARDEFLRAIVDSHTLSFPYQSTDDRPDSGATAQFKNHTQRVFL
ncbi:hypothetical protein LTSEINV_0511, partial [Salmonella enterica subsp. enterica serovar Inverness str. R8-3668]